jgi:hypothetical protein
MFSFNGKKDSIYIGPERRCERRRLQQSQRLGNLLKDCGLDRRGHDDRRRKDTSWFVTSDKVVNQ